MKASSPVVFPCRATVPGRASFRAATSKQYSAMLSSLGIAVMTFSLPELCTCRKTSCTSARSPVDLTQQRRHSDRLQLLLLCLSKHGYLCKKERHCQVSSTRRTYSGGGGGRGSYLAPTCLLCDSPFCSAQLHVRRFKMKASTHFPHVAERQVLKRQRGGVDELHSTRSPSWVGTCSWL